MPATLNLDAARAVIAATREKGRALGLKPLSVVVLDAGGHVLAFEREDGSSPLRFQVAHAKAYGAVGIGLGSRALFDRAQTQPFFVQALNGLAGGAVMPVPGGVLILGEGDAVVGAVGVTGDSSDNDEIAAIHGIEAAGFTAKAN